MYVELPTFAPTIVLIFADVVSLRSVVSLLTNTDVHVAVAKAFHVDV